MGSLWNRSGVVERYGADDLPARNAKAYFFLGGTTSPMSVYEDAGESGAHPHPVVADSTGRWPNIFVPYTLSYDVLVVNEFDVELTYTREIPNPDPVELTVDVPVPQAVNTGAIFPGFKQGSSTGYVRLNGRTIGNDVSGATERANADTELLFTYLWDNLSNTIAPVSGGRGSSAAADFVAGKTITLPSCRGMTLYGLDDMGGSTAGAYGGLTFTIGGATTPGSQIGGNAVSAADVPVGPHFHAGTTGPPTSGDSHTHLYPPGTPIGPWSTPPTLEGTTTTTMNNLGLVRLVSWYIKL